VPEIEYVRARTSLLDALEALQPHLDALVLVGAQAIHLRTGAADLVCKPGLEVSKPAAPASTIRARAVNHKAALKPPVLEQVPVRPQPAQPNSSPYPSASMSS